jgi:hypothetical protein
MLPTNADGASRSSNDCTIHIANHIIGCGRQLEFDAAVHTIVLL